MRHIEIAESDIARWEEADALVMSLLIDGQDPSVSRELSAFERLSLVAEDGVSIALTRIARERYSEALGWLRSAVRAQCERFCVGRQQQAGGLSAGMWQHLLLAHASTDQTLVDRFNDLFDLELAARPEARSTEDSMYHARLLKALTSRRIDDALSILGEPWPSVEPMFRGYIDCMQAIARRDETAFQYALSDASAAWERYARRHWKGLPDAVCFLNGVGLVRLAEHVWERPIKVDDPNIPLGLLGTVKPATIDLGL